MFNRYARLAFNIPVKEEFTYLIPDGMPVAPGMLAKAQLRSRTETGIVTGLENQTTEENLLPLEGVIYPDPLLSSEQLALSIWMSHMYLCSRGEALFKMFPAPTRKPARPEQKKGAELQPRELYPEQETIVRNISSASGGRHLIHGITGSGKTEIYIHLIASAISEKQTALLLLPEIALSVQIIERLSSVFGNELALLHSGMKPNARFASYLSLLRQEKSIVVGTRSAVFAPVANPALIILDEEHDGSFKEHTTPRYHTRQIAMRRTDLSGGTLVLGSATPSVETYFSAISGQMEHHELKKRAGNSKLPGVSTRIAVEGQPIGRSLLDEIKKNLELGEQTLLLLNRRGYHPYLLCDNCSRALSCPNCSVALCVHKSGRAVCHYCSFSMSQRASCPECNSALKPRSSGTEKLEEAVLAEFPEARIERLDGDVARSAKKFSAIDHLLAGQIDILVGTQMIAKGLDAPGVTLVGVLQSDRSLYLPDFRASERTFNLLTQVAGRAGRSEKQGRVIFELSAQPGATIKYALQHDYQSFIKAELTFRKEALYPPYVRIVRLLFRSPDATIALNKIETLHAILSRRMAALLETWILPASPAPIEKINHQYRYHIIIKTRQMRSVRILLEECLKKIERNSKSYLEVDFDPIDLF